MDLAAVDTNDLSRWLFQPTSRLLEHKDPCCKIARCHLLAMARSFDFRITEGQSTTGMHWLQSHFKWGSNPWPLYWCQAMKRKTIDCGVFAEFAKTIFEAKGYEVFHAQIIEKSSNAATAHYANRWIRESGNFEWIGHGFIYHEILGVTCPNDTTRLFDPTDAVWLNPRSISGFGCPIAVRSEFFTPLLWGPYNLLPDRWTELS